MLDLANTPKKERIIVALDCDMDRALSVADALQGKAAWLKVGMTLYYAEGPRIIRALKDKGFRIFLDLKFYDIPHQVFGAAASATRMGADMLTMHALGGADMMRAAVEGSAAAAEEAGIDLPILLGITVLTSMDASTLAAAGVKRSIEDQALSLALQARDAGLSGVVASPHEAARLREALGEEAYIVTPGVRPAGSARGDQHRIATPKDAFDAGASFLVIGRPIAESNDPAATFSSIAESL